MNNTAIGSTIVPTQPFGYNLLGGKLIAALVTSKAVRDEWQLRYGDVLAGMTTTSLYGSPCIYDRIPFWKKVGKTTGSVPVQSDVEIYQKWRKWLKIHKPKEFAEAIEPGIGWGPATSEKTRVINLIFKTVGISPKDYAHGFQRGIYFSSFYENTKEFLCGKIPETELKLKDRFMNDVEGIMDWWREIAIERYQKLKKKMNSN